MSAGSKAVKNTALTTLKTNLLPCIFSGLISAFVFFACNLVASLFVFAKLQIFANVVFYLLLFFLFLPLLLGLVRFYWRVILGVVDNPISVFYFFSCKKVYLKADKLLFSLTLKAFVRGIVFFTPAILLKLFSTEFFYKFFDIQMPLWSGNLGPIINGFITFGLVLLSFMMLKFYLAPMLFVSVDDMVNEEALHMSNVISKKSGIDFIYLCVSFLGWIIISYFVFPLIFTLPYMVLSYLYHCRFAIAEYNKHVEILNKPESETFAEGI